MKALKNHLSLIIPLFAILFAVEFYLIMDRIIKNYEKKLTQDYSIILISNGKLKLDEIKTIIPNAQELKEIDQTKILQRLKKDGIEIDYKDLKNFLPKFYQLYLNVFPSTQMLERYKKDLLGLKKIERVEVFVKAHRQIYKFLVLLQNISRFFLAIIFFISIMLIFKQLEIWYLEHKERMYIMMLFGAPLWMRSAILIKLSLFDTLISSILVYGIYYYIISSKYITKLFGVEELSLSVHQLFYDFLWLFLLGIGISFFNIVIISLRQSR